MTDRELLELAAKAAGISGLRENAYGQMGYYAEPNESYWKDWDPFEDDGDALRLAVQLALDICRPSSEATQVCVWVDHLRDFIEEPLGKDHFAATRRAIVRAASAIGASQAAEERKS